MTDEQLNKARYHAACDIAHRWFAFFEGETESVASHSDIFADDVMLVHAGTHLLAQGKKAMAGWLSSLPVERSSHFIRRIEVIPQAGQTGNVLMDIGYQAVRRDGSVGGALTEYHTNVKFSPRHEATFSFIQKTPRLANPDTVFRDSFGENRVKSFNARFAWMLLTAATTRCGELLHPNADRETIQIVHALITRGDIADVEFAHFNALRLTSSLVIRTEANEWRLLLELNESAGRYATIRSAKLV